jgi:hypothetical protein
MNKLKVMPPTQPPSVWPTRKELDHTIEEMRWLVDQCEEFEKWIVRLRECPSDVKALNRLKCEIIEFGEAFKDENGLEELDKACYPDFWWIDNDDCIPKRSEVAKMIGGLVGSFPTSNVKNPEVFIRNLLDDVLALDPDFVVLETTCRALRTEQKFMPSISEVLAEYRKQAKIWLPRFIALDHARIWYDAAVERVASIEQQAKPALANDPSLPLAMAAPVAAPLVGVPVNGRNGSDDFG